MEYPLPRVAMATPVPEPIRRRRLHVAAFVAILALGITFASALSLGFRPLGTAQAEPAGDAAVDSVFPGIPDKVIVLQGLIPTVLTGAETAVSREEAEPVALQYGPVKDARLITVDLVTEITVDSELGSTAINPEAVPGIDAPLWAFLLDKPAPFPADADGNKYEGQPDAVGTYYVILVSADTGEFIMGIAGEIMPEHFN